MNEMVVHKPICRPTVQQLWLAPTTYAAGIIDLPLQHRAVGPIRLPPARQFSADRAGRTAKKPPHRPLAAAPTMLGEDHAALLAAEMLASSVHRNILRPSGSGCCT
jgi:hypothetical protein